jgi:NAD(P)-dependent dehydrogenase (short-subunit alcohol dehydrogenase family)
MWLPAPIIVEKSIHFNDINLEKGYNGWKAYSQSKLANVLFTYELVRRLGEKWVTANTLTPGFVATRIGHNTGIPSELGAKTGWKNTGRGGRNNNLPSFFIRSSSSHWKIL